MRGGQAGKMPSSKGTIFPLDLYDPFGLSKGMSAEKKVRKIQTFHLCDLPRSSLTPFKRHKRLLPHHSLRLSPSLSLFRRRSAGLSPRSTTGGWR